MSNWKWCATDENGNVIKGWYQDKGNNKWYHLSEDNGTLDLGWFQDKDKRWYYLDDKNGDLKTGWIQLKSIWYYLEPNSTGYMGECYVDCTATIGGKEYTFDENGHMLGNSSDSLVSDNLAQFIEGFEGCYLTAYYCPSHVLTIGIGNTSEKWTSLGTITKEQAYEALKEDMQTFADGVDNLANSTNVTLNIYQREALISFSFNAGLSALSSSTLWKNICNGVTDSATITENFGRWNKGSDGILAGLTKRRKCESRLYLTGDYSTEI